MGRGPRPLPPGEVERRKAYLEPLLTYLAEHHYTAGLVAAAAFERAERSGEMVVRSRHVWLAKMKRGDATIPPWFVTECCAVIGKSVARVMGSTWIRRYGADGRGLPSGGTERAPVGYPRLQRPWRRTETAAA